MAKTTRKIGKTQPPSRPFPAPQSGEPSRFAARQAARVAVFVACPGSLRPVDSAIDYNIDRMN